MARRDIWAYNPDVCDGNPCILNCDYCSLCEKAQEANGDFDDEPSDADLEMGFDPYEGCYTYDC